MNQVSVSRKSKLSQLIQTMKKKLDLPCFDPSTDRDRQKLDPEPGGGDVMQGPEVCRNQPIRRGTGTDR